jgi:hypothetical protein
LESGSKSSAALQEEARNVASAQVREGGLDAIGDHDLCTSVAQNRGVSFGRNHDEH